MGAGSHGAGDRTGSHSQCPPLVLSSQTGNSRVNRRLPFILKGMAFLLWSKCHFFDETIMKSKWEWLKKLSSISYLHFSAFKLYSPSEHLSLAIKRIENYLGATATLSLGTFTLVTYIIQIFFSLLTNGEAICPLGSAVRGEWGMPPAVGHGGSSLPYIFLSITHLESKLNLGTFYVFKTEI